MPRRQRVLKRPATKEDKIFGSVLVTRLINRIMMDGKKTVATKIVTNAIKKASDELQVAPLDVVETAVSNVRPNIEVKSVRVGGANYQVPIEPYEARALRLSLTWIVNAARSVKGKPMSDKLKQVLIESYNGEGSAVAKRNSVHQTAAGNKAFAHLAMRIGKKK
ncbi:30S ribosomal protein S7 [Candidatus Gracilibacteria bacterium]|nr:30S ribosomal protein S7 [Thermales bacterium]NJL96845.1 30S ribosomal protein S7 [Candidatus Gracilibacteria bacterium]